MGLFKVLANQLGVSRHLRYSWLYDCYAQFQSSEYASTLANDRRFYSDLFRAHRVRRVFDVGANVGDKTRVFRELGTSVVCVEPDPDLAAVLRFRFKRNPGVAIEVAAVGAEPGTARLHRKRFPGFNTLSEKWSARAAELSVPDRDAIDVPITTLDALIEAHGPPDYIKIDVEGYELPAVRGLSASVRVVSFECNLPTMRTETTGVVERLLELAPNSRFNGREVDQPRMVFAGCVGRDELLRLIDVTRPATYDLFAFNHELPPGP